jgi:alpha-L-fucosidase
VVNVLNESPDAFNQRMEWWREAKFGMFIHWGPYAVPAGIHKGEEVEGIGEWIMEKAAIPVAEYEEYSRAFNPEQFDADRWVQLARDAGMKYLVITSKHHDGFGLWDSEVSDYDVMDFSPIKRDLLGELKEACDKYDVKLCFYHSIMDWHHPQAQAPNYPDYNAREDTTRVNPEFDQYVENYLKPQLSELVEKYDPYVIWFDGEWIPDWTHEHGVDMYRYLRELKPSLIINNRVDVGRKGMQGMNDDSEDYVGDFGTPEQEILEEGSDVDWEACMTMNDTWGYKKNDDNWKSAKVLIHNLIDVAAKGGNYLLNVGPTAEGLIPEASVERLEAMGAWLDVNGEAIYATERLPLSYDEGDPLRYTRKKGQPYRYGILMESLSDAVDLPELLPREGSEVHLLGYDAPLDWRVDGGTLTVTVPQAARQAVGQQVAYVFKVEAEE